MPGADHKSCPYCGETILSVAVKCRFCGEALDAVRFAELRSMPAVRRCPACAEEIPTSVESCPECDEPAPGARIVHRGRALYVGAGAALLALIAVLVAGVMAFSTPGSQRPPLAAGAAGRDAACLPAPALPPDAARPPAVPPAPAYADLATLGVAPVPVSDIGVVRPAVDPSASGTAAPAPAPDSGPPAGRRSERIFIRVIPDDAGLVR